MASWQETHILNSKRTSWDPRRDLQRTGRKLGTESAFNGRDGDRPTVNIEHECLSLSRLKGNKSLKERGCRSARRESWKGWNGFWLCLAGATSSYFMCSLHWGRRWERFGAGRFDGPSYNRARDLEFTTQKIGEQEMIIVTSRSYWNTAQKNVSNYEPRQNTNSRIHWKQATF